VREGGEGEGAGERERERWNYLDDLVLANQITGRNDNQ